MLATIPPYWQAYFEHFAIRVGDPRREEGRAPRRARSPLHKAGNITKPMLIGHGANDPRCKIAESDQIVAAMCEKHIPVTYVVFPDEGHGFARPENRLAFNAIAEAFLARHLGGRCEPVGDDFDGSSHEVRAGAEILHDIAPQTHASAMSPLGR
jgi:dipeptidyl aminopeptidase/acylaminoacyl peptidase